jgi:hypothetical protein
MLWKNRDVVRVVEPSGLAKVLLATPLYDIDAQTEVAR